jgi:hypothetical protein
MSADPIAFVTEALTGRLDLVARQRSITRPKPSRDEGDTPVQRWVAADGSLLRGPSADVTDARAVRAAERDARLREMTARGMTVGQMAERLGLTPHACRAALRRARNR